MGVGMSQSVGHGVRCLILMLAWLAVAGCGGQSPYPQTVARTPVGRDGVCFACQKKIDQVKDANLVTIGATRFVVCDEKCEAKAKQMAENGGEDGHKH